MIGTWNSFLHCKWSCFRLVSPKAPPRCFILIDNAGVQRPEPLQLRFRHQSLYSNEKHDYDLPDLLNRETPTDQHKPTAGGSYHRHHASNMRLQFTSPTQQTSNAHKNQVLCIRVRQWSGAFSCQDDDFHEPLARGTQTGRMTQITQCHDPCRASFHHCSKAWAQSISRPHLFRRSHEWSDSLTSVMLLHPKNASEFG